MPSSEGSTNQIKEKPQKHLTDDQHNETKEQGRVTQPVASIAGRSELQNRESESGQTNRYAQIRQCYDGVKRWARIVTKDFRHRSYRATFFLEVLGFLVLSFYAWEAYKQKVEMAKSVEQQVLSNGPLIYPNGAAPTGFTADHIPNKVHVIFHNYGKSLALTIVAIGHIMMSGKSPPRDPNCDPDVTSLPKGAYIDALEADPTKSLEKDWLPLNEKELSEDNRGQTLYAVGCVYYYGIDRTHIFYTDVCVLWDPTKPQVFQTCNDPARSYAR
ncbi:hypothetical protein [Candidatus Binatus sp.]|uniref:hypothetical protein n=1 Tax=Candidatus Binatus sp. TaxID=2811406 RepID=UPI002F936C70